MIEILNKNKENLEIILGERFSNVIAKKTPDKTCRNTINHAVYGNVKNHYDIKKDRHVIILETFKSELELRRATIDVVLDELKAYMS